MKAMLRRRGIYTSRDMQKRKKEFLFQMDNSHPLHRRTCIQSFKRAARAAGLDGNFNGISFRKGGNQELMDKGIPLGLRMNLGRWRSAAAHVYGRMSETIHRLLHEAMARVKDDMTDVIVRLHALMAG